MPSRPDGQETPAAACLHELVAAQAARTPGAVALVAGDRRLTYRDLACAAGRLARRLAALGVGPEVRVGVFLSRSPALVTTLLGILEAGGAYVPLDPDYPRQHLGFMLEDAGIAVLVTETALAALLPASGARVLVLDGEPGGDEAEPVRPLPGNLAYLIYTSGSTGRPKAVAIEHRSAVAFVHWAHQVFTPEELAAVLAATSICFDLSIFELFVPLSRGGRVVLAADALALPRLPAAGEVTLVNTVPSAMAELVRAGALPAGVRTVNLAGEPLRGSLAQAVYAAGAARVLNLYGPSEDTTYSTFEVVERGSRREPTIGRPIAGTRVRLLDGEICLGGAGLARGYLGRPGLTAERFVPDPEADTPGERLYRTGDLGRALPDGRIEYLGRLDQQVKVRGFRVELGEIEVALAAHPGVREVAVVAREDGPGEKRLVAWFAGEPSGAELRAFLGSRLPAHMVPARFVALPALPLTPNRKVDRQALTRRALPPESAAGESPAPRTPTEELLAGIWEEVLGRGRVGVDESFLELGGDSLLAARVQARVQAALELDLLPSAVLAASTVAALAEQVELALAERPSRPSRLAPSLPRPRPRDPAGEPLSSAQRRLWFLERLAPEAPVNNIPVVMRLEGPLSPAVLERCLTEIAARHQALRTAIRLGPDGEPLQLVAPPAPVPLPLVDLAGLPDLQRSAERERLARAEARRPLDLDLDLDLDQAALWRLRLVRTEATGHDLLATFHHVIADGASIQVIERELAALYPAFLHGSPSPLPPPALQPADVAAWERDGLSAEAVAPHAAFFREHLAGAPGRLDLPADRPRPPARSWRGVSRALDLPPSLAREVRELARRRGATRYMVLLAAWVALLRRITGQDDLVVGTVFAQRGRPELEGMVGYFANALPLRVERSGDPAFGSLLATVRARALAVFAHQDLPLETLAGVLRPRQAAGAEPLFQAFFAYRGNAGPRELAPGLTLTWREEDHGAAQFDLLLDLEEKGEEIAGRLVASADLFTAATAGRLARGWTALLADALARPEAPLSDLDLLGAAERHALLAEWSRAAGPPAWDGPVPARIAAWAAATPEAVAVLPADPGQPGLTYRELMERARRLAGHLRSRGVGLDVRVAVYAERSPETVVGMLAVLLAGGAFLPLDPAHPAERLAWTLEDARVPVLLARSALAATLPTGDAEVVALETESPESAEPLQEAAPEDLAYVIYTSGSTGRPKGVLIQHRGFLWAVEALAEASGVEPGSRVLQFASASFDASVWEIWSTLVRGAALVFARSEDLLPGQALLDTLLRRGITNVFLTPSALAALPDGASRELAGLRGLVVGGEAFPPALVTRWAAGSPGRRLWNAYGPTEASICVSMARLGEDGQAPIGRPVADSRLLVLGPHGELLPPGVAGELHIGGRGLARGYLGRPDLTAAAFVPDPTGLPGEPAGARQVDPDGALGARQVDPDGALGARLYRTGDLVRFRPDGQLEFVGRADSQVKVRGFRIEPGEIEVALAAHPGVREVAVVPYEAAPRDLRLAAYVVAAGPDAPPAQELRAFLRSRLPEPMVPSSFAFLPALPLTPGGKVDRRALPAPAAEQPAPAAGRGFSGTPAEELLAGIWGEVLGRTEIGTGDDFFDLGGHSLLVGQVLARVRTAFGVELPVRATFEDRALAALARRIEEARLAQAGGPAPEPLVRVPRDRPLPLSFGQERLWFLHRLDPGSPAYNLPLAFRLTGALGPELLERSLDEVFRRHEVLRTTFAEGPDGEPYQDIAPFQAPGLPRIDLSGLSAGLAAAEADRQMAREARRPFDLVRGPVARAFLLRLGGQEHLLVFSCHHAAFDGWSVGVLRRELGALYNAFRAGRRSPLPELAVQYADHAVWQRRRLSGETLAAQLAFWRQRLAGAPAALELPADRLRPPAQSFRGATLPFAIPAGLAAGLRGLARSEGSTLFLTALSAFFALLGRITGQTDLVVGSPVANRREAGSEDLLGFFVNTLALRAGLAGDPSFRALAAQVRESALACYTHQDLPFERLVEELQPARDPSRSPLFQVLFSLDPLQDGELAPGLDCELLRIDTGTAKFDLSLYLNDQGGSLTALLEYATDLFDAPTAARLGRSFLALLSGLMAEGTGLPVSRLPLLGAAESWQLRGEWHEPLPDVAAVCLHDLVAAQAARTPAATALVAGNERLTWRELDRRAGELARRLAALGVGPEVRVGVCLSRSPALVVSLLGILEAGGAYVPLDPNYPRERLGFMLEDADAAVLITETALASRLPASRARVLVLDGEPEAAEPEAAEEAGPLRALPGSLPGNLAYLIYTSGSTGRPKAVAIEHRSAVAFVHWAREAFAPAELASVLASTSISFDLSVFELFVPLALGGTVVLAGSVLELPDLPAAGEVVTVNSVPSAVSALLELVGALPAGVRTVNLAGEPLKGSLAQALYATGVERVRNLYGPSEDTTYSTFETVERGSRREPTIGRPIAGTWARLLDRNLELAPVGVPGEIYLGGAGLARGYLGRPELTAERFVPDPLGEPGARLYRTGDLGRHLPDGRIEYMGRLDHQVKVRGFRIELGEIETALEAHPQVREAVVVARGEAGGDRFLAAYVVPAGPPAPTPGELAEHLRVRLAEFMVPSTFTLLDAMPLTPNGKVDRKALPAPGSGPATPAMPLGPAAPLVELLAGIWAEVLGRDELPAPHESFFELGGHSLLATRVVSRVRAALGIEVPLRTLFAAPTLSSLAAAVSAITAAPPPDPIEPLADRTDLPLSFAQQRLWLLDRLEPGSPVYNLPFPRRILGPLAPAVLERALAEVERRHEVLRTTFAVDEESGEPRLAVAPPGGFPLPRIDLAALPPEAAAAEARRLADEDAASPFDLAAGPLFRARLLALGAGEHHLLMTVHHVAGDGWSINLLLNELSALYPAFAAGRPSPLPEPAIQYADFAAWQRRWLEGPVLAGQLAYWRRQLAGAPAVLDLPADRPRPPVATSRGAHFLTALPAALTAEVRALSRHQGATLFMVLLAAFAALLERYTGETDLLLGSPIAGRGLAEIEGLAGFFVNTLVLRVDLSGAPSFGALIARVRETALAAYAHQDVPFERLVEELQPERSLARSPLFEVSFVLGVEETARELAPGLSHAPLTVENHTAKFDLTLGLDLRGDTLVADFEFRTDLFDRSTVERWAGHFTRLLAAAAARPDVPLPGIDLFSAAERHHLLREWNDRHAWPASGPFVHELVSAHARQAPAALAVADGERRLSYGELDRRAVRLARTLRALGCGPEVRVGICLQRSPELAIAALAVLKAGGAYVPLDPAHPAERLAYQLEDAQVEVLLTRRGPAADHAARQGIHCLFPHEDEDGPEAAAGDLPAPALLPGNLAYMIYTSGSSGLPKAVEIPHAGLTNLVRWHQGLYGVVPGDRATLTASPAFDASVWELWPYLTAGASLHIPDEEIRLSPSRTVRWWAEQGITLTFLITPLAEEVLEEALPPGLDLRLRALITGGDRLHRRPAAGAPFRLMNHYGPSEYSVVTTVAPVPPMSSTPAHGAGEHPPAIGRPIDGTRVHLLDRLGEPVPLGAAGELHVAGRGLARGYHRRPGLTAERFVPDPFAAEPGGRLYRTGDLARYRPDGEIEYLGRGDAQVKLRGFRIELGEVETVLASHPAVEQAVVDTYAYGPGDVRLVAWVVLAAEGVETEALLSWLGEKLPDFMVPAALVVLPALPLTPNGKLDHRALPPPAVPSPSQASAEPPRSPLEELVAGLWAEALGRGAIGLHDHFFELGGYSLLAIRVLARLRAATGVDLPLRAIFANPTVATLAAEIESSLRAPLAAGAEPLPPVEPAMPAGTGADAPAAAAQERLWYFHQLDRSGSVLNVPNPLRLSGPLRPAALARSLSEIARRHASLRTTFWNGPEGIRQRIAPPADLVLPLADLSALPPARREEEARRATEAEAREPFDLAAGPLWRARLLRLDGDEHRLLLTFHHIVVDGWSIDLLERELAVLYPAFLRELPSPLPEPALQYADFAVWQRRELTPERLAPQLDWWRRQLAGMPTVLDLPADRPRPPRPTFRGAARYLPLPQELAAQTKELGRHEGTTLFMTALAAFAALVGRYTGRTDVVLGSPAANRHTPGTEGIFGFFVGLLPFRLDLSGDPTFRELLRRAREAALGAYAHPDVPFERLVEELDPARDKSRTPLVQVMLSVRNGAGEPLRFAGLAVEPVEAHSATSQFDFTLGVVDLPHGLTLEAEYSTDLFAGATVERMLAHLAQLLGAVAADPEIRLSALPAGIGPPKPVETPPVETSSKPPAATDRGARLAARRAGLSAEERALLDQRLRARGPKADAPPPASASLVALQPAGSRPPFFCVHPAGGDVLAFQALSRHLGPDQPFHGLQSRGLGPGEVPFESIEEMAARYRAEITAASPGPYHLGGWSLGGAVAFEVARQLAAEGREVALLAIVDSTPGPWPRPATETETEDDGDDTPWLLEIADYLERLWGLDLGLTAENLRGLSSEDQALRLLAGLKDTPFGAKAGPESLRRLLAVFKTNVRAFRRYRPAPYPGKITLFLPAEANGSPEEAAPADPTHGWGALSPLPVDVETVPGDHVSALAEPHVRTLAERLRHCIDRSPGLGPNKETCPK